MRPAEIMLRVAAGIGGWIILFAHALVLSVIPRADCGGDSTSLWGGTMILGGVAGIGALTLSLGLRWRDSLRWAALLVLPLALYNLSWIVPAIGATTLGTASLCALTATPELATGPPNGIERAWPVLQASVLLAGLVQGLRHWTPR